MIHPFESFVWWTGVVEDRMDPLFLGRCRVRIHGFHSEFTQSVTDGGVSGGDYIPVNELPWALPTNSITSASMTGIGQAPVGPVEGTWVFGFFMDGAESQVPIMVGTIGGIEMAQKEPDPSLSVAGDGSPTSANSSPTQPTPPTTTTPVTVPTPQSVQTTTGGVIGPLDQTDVNNLKAALGKRESSNNYGVVNKYGYLGKYQFGNEALKGQGYTRSDNNKMLGDPNNWTGKDGINSQQDYLNSTSAQEGAMDGLLTDNYEYLLNKGIVTPTSSKEDVAGYLAVMHLKGPTGAKNLSKGIDTFDGNGTSAASYYAIGVNSVNASTTPAPSTPPLPPTDTGVANPQPNFPTSPQSPANSPSSFSGNLGFQDPNHVYPKLGDQKKRPDTNYLAYRDHIELTSVKTKEDAQTKAVEVALSADDNWDQPLSPYNASYPFNHVLETESGHVMEFDDTGGNERINLWHKTGSFLEIDKNGTEVHKIVGDEYWILDRNGFITIGGKCNLTIEGDGNIYVKNNANIQVDGDTEAKFYRNVTSEVSGKFKMSVLDDFDVRAKSIHFETYADTNGEAFTIKNKSQSGSVRIQSAGDIEFLAGNEFRVKSNAKLSLRTCDIFAADAKTILFQRNASAEATPVVKRLPDDESMFEPDPMKSPQDPSFPVLHTTHYSDLTAMFYDTPGYPPDDVAQHIANNISNGNFSNADASKVPETAPSDTTIPPANATVPTPPITVPPPNSGTTYSPALQLSSNFTLAQLSSRALVIPTTIIAQNGLDEGTIVGNLSTLASTTLEPILAQYPSMIVASGFRLTTGSTTVSPHELGQAVDLQFPGFGASDYYGIAAWIRDNCQFDQLILEYKTTGSETPWIHVSCNASGNRRQVLSMLNSQPLSGSTDSNIVTNETTGPTPGTVGSVVQPAVAGVTSTSASGVNTTISVAGHPIQAPAIQQPTPTIIANSAAAGAVSVPWGKGVNWQPFTIPEAQIVPIQFNVSSLLKSFGPQISFSNGAGSQQFKVQLTDQPMFGLPSDPNLNEIVFDASFGGRFVISVNAKSTPPTQYIANLIVGKTYYLVVQNVRPNLGSQTFFVSMPI